MLPGEWKPILTALVLPPAGPLLLAFLGVLVATRRRGAGLAIATLGLVLAFALGTNAVALLLAPHLMPGVAVAKPQDLASVQAVVVLGGGVLPEAPEYGAAQPSPPTLQRIRYGAWLARRTGKPLAFSGGMGWAASERQQEAEGAVARRVLQDEYGLAVRWVDERSRDTAENAARMVEILRPERIARIALVTDAAHMPRAAAAFRAAGFDVVPAPTDFPVVHNRPVLEWMPSPHGAATNRYLVREWLGRLVAGT
ncbi:MAG TPA: YdcF family protein [Ramlibacter sp.]|uniref:YdcF family protein n=1 Tax=Ramlibacter sp. TaxID=1917967 RepID=UPI002ED3022A